MFRVIQIGAIAVVLAVSTLFVFELDRFFVPKELVLHVTAVIVGLIAIKRIQFTRIDWLLAGFLGLSAISAVFATNPWLAMRAAAISASGILLFWAARTIGPRATHAVAIAIVLVAITSLLQTYGVYTQFFSENRAPGGTLGNRNFVAHAAAFGLPVLLFAAIRAQRWITFLLAACGSAMVTATLVLTRSRAAWLAFAAVVFIFLIGMMLRGDARGWRRLAGVMLLTGGGVAGALLLPNALRWRSDNPYLETLNRVASYQEGSGRGRLIQYVQSLKMAAHHPLLGVGPGNWGVRYPEHATKHDPSMSDNADGTTTNPWPSSDWIAFISERGLAATILLGLAMLGIATSAFQREGLEGVTLFATLAGAVIAGAFDAVLLLALPTFLIWTALGALSPPREGANRVLVVAAVVIVSAIGVERSAAQLVAMQIYATRSDRTSLTRASHIDPGNFRLQLRLSRMGNHRDRCEHALAARALYPNSEAARAAARGCER